ncbi:hypothetical protein PLICRDRAFT_142726, partial [Plicaturopsis crispa FD-325 SS-3]
MDAAIKPVSSKCAALDDCPGLGLSAEPQRSNIWYQDGSIVLEAERLQFRVHISVLAAHSLIFKDMLEIGQSSVGEYAVEGCPLVHLSDSAQDLTYVLTAFYDRKFFDLREPQPFPVIAAMLRLGKKYELEYFYTEALSRVASECPTSLERWDAGSDELITNDDDGGLYFDMANLLRETDTISALPVTLYTCGQWYTHRELLEGLDCGSALSATNRTACLIGLDRLRLAALAHIDSWLTSNNSTCTTPAECSSWKAALVITESRTVEGFEALAEWRPRWETHLCRACTRHYKGLYNDNRRKLWEALPSFFDLPDWEHM